MSVGLEPRRTAPVTAAEVENAPLGSPRSLRIHDDDAEA